MDYSRTIRLTEGEIMTVIIRKIIFWPGVFSVNTYFFLSLISILTFQEFSANYRIE